MTTFAEINEQWYSPKSDKAVAQFLAAFENAMLHFEACLQPIQDTSLEAATRIFDNAAKHLAVQGKQL